MTRKFIWHTDDLATPQITLGDDAVGDYIDDPQAGQESPPRKVAYFRGGYVQNLPGYNWEEKLKWTVARKHASEEVAENFRRDHAKGVPKNGRLAEFVNGNQVRFLQNAAIESIWCIEHNGSATTFQYTVSGGPWTDTLNEV